MRLCSGVILFLGMMACSQARAQTAADAIALERAGRLADAEQAWSAVAARDPKDARALANLGLVLAREGKYPEAAGAYRRALAVDPKLPGVQLDLGLAEFKQGDFKRAAPAFRAAVAEAPGNMQAETLLGMSYYGAGEFAKAVPPLRDAVKSSPRNEELLGVLAQSCLYAKEYACTLEQYRQIVTLNPNSAQADMLAGEALDAMNRTTEAVQQFQAAEKAAPGEPNVHFGLGYLEWKQHHYGDAEKEFDLELQNEPDNTQAMSYLGDTQMQLQQPAAAEATLRKAVSLPGAPRLAWVDLGAVLAGQGKNDEAAEDFRRAIAMDPSQVDAHWRLARLLLAEGKRTEAQAEFAKAAALHQKQDTSLVNEMSGPGGGHR